MSEPARYAIPAGPCRHTEEIKRSRFLTSLGYAPTEADARKFIDDIRVEFPDASHNCWSYLIGPPGQTAQAGMSDDGEPHATAGRPMLTVLIHSGVGDIVAVVTRYFGGTKLGKGGLVRAYSGGVQKALDILPRAEHLRWAYMRVILDYPFVEPFKRILPEYESQIGDEKYGARVVFEIKLPEAKAPDFRDALADMTNGRVEIQILPAP